MIFAGIRFSFQGPRVRRPTTLVVCERGGASTTVCLSNAILLRLLFLESAPGRVASSWQPVSEGADPSFFGDLFVDGARPSSLEASGAGLSRVMIPTTSALNVCAVWYLAFVGADLVPRGERDGDHERALEQRICARSPTWPLASARRRSTAS
jgi:hypothetical protein